MPLADSLMPAVHELVTPLRDAVLAVEALFEDARRAVANRVTIEGRPVSRILDREQRATHGLAWLATYVEAIRQLEAYSLRLAAAGSFGEIEELLVRIGIGEYLAQVIGGIPMSQGEIVRLSDLGLSPAAVAARIDARRRTSHRQRQYRSAPRPPGRTDPAASRRDGRRLRAR